MMKQAVITFGAAVAALHSVSVDAMEWCQLFDLIPREQSDFERISGSVEAMTGCDRQPSDSVHSATWVCPDDTTTNGKYEGIHLHLFREPGEGVHLLVVAEGIANLDRLRTCGSGEVRNGARFEPGNVAFRDRLIVRGARLTLTSIVPGAASAIITDSGRYGEDSVVTRFWRNAYGIQTEPYPSTEVKLAGLSPISNDVFSIAAAFQARGSTIRESSDLDGVGPKWKLSPPTGLAGVTEVEIDGFAKHLHSARYVLASTEDYQRYIDILDSEYGRSERQIDGPCTFRRWESGRMLLQGEHCEGKRDIIFFLNRVASSQLDQYVTKVETDQKNSEKVSRPTIDKDNL